MRAARLRVCVHGDGTDQRSTAPLTPVSALGRSLRPRRRRGLLPGAWRVARDRDPRLPGLGARWSGWESVLAGVDDRAGGLPAAGSAPATSTADQSAGGNP